MVTWSTESRRSATSPPDPVAEQIPQIPPHAQNDYHVFEVSPGEKRRLILDRGITLPDSLPGVCNRTVTCSRCGITAPAAEPRVSVRAVILALARFGLASKEQ